MSFRPDSSHAGQVAGAGRGAILKGVLAYAKRLESVSLVAHLSVAALRVWLKAHTGRPADPLFPSRTGGSLSRDAVERLVLKHAATAQRWCPSLRDKRLSPHVLRHTAAMTLLQAGVDSAVIALWLGHEGVETTQLYLHADLSLKERAFARTAPAHTKPGRYRAPDTLLAFLESL
jgi:site-specific recombinase XerD